MEERGDGSGRYGPFGWEIRVHSEMPLDAHLVLRDTILSLELSVLSGLELKKKKKSSLLLTLVIPNAFIFDVSGRLSQYLNSLELHQSGF